MDVDGELVLFIEAANTGEWEGQGLLGCLYIGKG